VRAKLFALLITSIFISCEQQEKRDSELIQSEIVTSENDLKSKESLSSVFSKRGSKIPKSAYKSLGVENLLEGLFTDTLYTVSNGSQVCVFSDVPSGCTDFYCYANYYVALVNTNSCSSLLSVPITLGSKPEVVFLEDTYLCISNEIEQYSSKEGNHAASITDDIVDFKKSIAISGKKLVEIQL